MPCSRQRAGTLLVTGLQVQNYGAWLVLVKGRWALALNPHLFGRVYGPNVKRGPLTCESLRAVLGIDNGSPAFSPVLKAEDYLVPTAEERTALGEPF